MRKCSSWTLPLYRQYPTYSLCPLYFATFGTSVWENPGILNIPNHNRTKLFISWTSMYILNRGSRIHVEEDRLLLQGKSVLLRELGVKTRKLELFFSFHRKPAVHWQYKMHVSWYVDFLRPEHHFQTVDFCWFSTKISDKIWSAQTEIARITVTDLCILWLTADLAK